jgi:hypothetical protein
MMLAKGSGDLFHWGLLSRIHCGPYYGERRSRAWNLGTAWEL